MSNISVDTITYKQLAKMFDHAILKPEHTAKDVEEGCRLAREYDAMSVCVKPCDVKQASELLKGSDVLVGTVISFPHGNSPTAGKVAEALQTVEDGAVELDIVINIGHLKSGKYDECQNEIKTIIDACKQKNPKVIFKIIFENAYLTKEEIVKACQISVAAGAEFVKTSTGFASSGATFEDCELMRANVPDNVQVKASGGIKSLDQVITFMQKGVTRCGSSSTDKILDEFKKRRNM
ncbi:deoxyribose-phosphate aldolase [Radiomyces spectabilis]|uniref:deoxyribose-phosphate aldolase n=1 Tax=Radiomyces spectabilis TaxID=64574 RepID=UPI0022201F02|nr:deoxyribose-phosphate aldolase [Radiomyces spectabilis]KAI8391648.1 deoxyribose-phosphate aldolase [Radiomyces spectabilis]